MKDIINKKQIVSVKLIPKQRNLNYWWHEKRKGLFSFLSKETGWYHIDSPKRLNEPYNENAVTSYFENYVCYYHPYIKIFFSDKSTAIHCFTDEESMKRYYEKEIKPFIAEMDLSLIGE